jgi:anthranilate phosphoribosyltransferase
VSHAKYGPLFAEIFRAQGKKRALVVHSEDGLDEISISAPTTVWELAESGDITQRTVQPSDFGLPTHPIESLQGGDAQERVAKFRAVLEGEKVRGGGSTAKSLKHFADCLFALTNLGASS